MKKRSSKVKYFARWSKTLATALDAYPDEFVSYANDWKKRHQLFDGPFDNRKTALKLALERCYDLRNDGKHRKRKRPQPLVMGGTYDDYDKLKELVTKVLRSR